MLVASIVLLTLRFGPVLQYRTRNLATMPCNLEGGQLGQNGPKGEGSTLIPRARTTLALEGDERWFLVHTQPHSERKAELHLGAQGFRAFLPQIQKTIRHARQLRTVRAPLFPRYMFLILDLGRDRWLSVRSTVGVLLTVHLRGSASPRS